MRGEERNVGTMVRADLKFEISDFREDPGAG
jgi:hypothetical protein